MYDGPVLDLDVEPEPRVDQHGVARRLCECAEDGYHVDREWGEGAGREDWFAFWVV